MGAASSADSARGANSTLRQGTRVQTQYTIAEGGDDRWYCGTVAAVYKGDKVKIKYDDGDKWTGPACYVWSLSGSPPPCGGQRSESAYGGRVVNAVPVQGQVYQGTAVSSSGQPVYAGQMVATNNVANQQPDLPSNIPPPELAVDGEPSCPVCTTNRMDFALACGHRCCGGCLKMLADRKQPCPVCREPILQVIRLYN